MPNNLLEQAHALAPGMVAQRRDFHRHPELSFREVRTAGIVADTLRGLGLPVRTGVGRTGVVADIENGSGPTVALRADMDALPIHEEGNADYGSTVPGVMHACGHDAHTAGLLGVARLLVADREAGRMPPGRIRLLFQPSEEGMDDEGKSGAMRMLEEGAMEGVDAVIGLHVWASLPSGILYFREGPLLAGSDEILVEVRGKSSHAARPHEGIDALVLAAQGVMAAQTVVSRGLSPLDEGVLTLGTIRGGVAPNVIADRVHLHGTLRYFQDEVRRRLQAGVRGAFETARSLGGDAQVTVRPGYPPVVNDPTITRWVREAAEELVGPEGVQEAELTMGAEDFAFLGRAAPGTFFLVGAGLPERREHHHPRFDIDESVLPLGAAAMVAGARRVLLSLAATGP
jgi:IAA-amino acid hydrolase